MLIVYKSHVNIEFADLLFFSVKRVASLIVVYVRYLYSFFLPKCPLTTVRSQFSADKLQIVRGEAEGF